MPFLRFSRDKRGYANTYLCHTFREDGIVRMRVLYWFRSPPDIAVGRPALDAEAIRDIEASNPALTFDWEEILKAKPPAAPPDREGPERRERRTRRRGRGAAAGNGGASAGAAAPEGSSSAASDDGAAPATGSAPAAGEPPAVPEETAGTPVARPGRRRRRRRRSGGGAGDEQSAPAAVAAPAPPAESDSEPA